MSLRSALAAVFLGVGLWYGLQAVGTGGLLLVWTEEGTASKLWPVAAWLAGMAVGSGVIGLLLARRTRSATDVTSPAPAWRPWDLARYGLGLYALYRATLALGAIVGVLLEEPSKASVIVRLMPKAWPGPWVELVVGIVFGAALLAGPRVVAGTRRVFRRRGAEGSPA